MRARSALMAATALALTGCGGASHSSSSATSQASSSATAPAPVVRSGGALRLSSAAFPSGSIPRQYTCDGQDVSPPLRWSGVPRGTRELVLLMRDPDAPGGSFTHWALAGIPPAIRGLSAGQAPPGAIEGRNGFGTVGYRGPCPPSGAGAHHYVLTLSALARPVKLKPGFKSDALAVPAIASATLVGTYARR